MYKVIQLPLFFSRLFLERALTLVLGVVMFVSLASCWDTITDEALVRLILSCFAKPR